MHRTNVELDEKLMSEAIRLTGMTTKKEVVNYALSELVRKKKRKGILKLEGKVLWTGNLNEMRKMRGTNKDS
ncbi:MAG: transcriptional regulator of the Arc/MetJ class [candidate division Zixibacteria bacterium RBG_16_53_22]|nr:MAG: transcriptional regulator of the Arc/MetJ class [candidate division Zixibacteria bacterium RBG_16_53_22]